MFSIIFCIKVLCFDHNIIGDKNGNK